MTLTLLLSFRESVRIGTSHTDFAADWPRYGLVVAFRTPCVLHKYVLYNSAD